VSRSHTPFISLASADSATYHTSKTLVYNRHNFLFPTFYSLSNTEATSTFSMSTQAVFLVWGGDRGWIGQMMVELLKKQGKQVHSTMTPMEEQSQVRAVLDDVKPTHVINCAGKTGRPTVDWCESHQVETLETNCLGVHIVTSECHKRNIHCTIVATGCT
jgi:FlaA1/EpsC-like NDP-sugar epimerase